MAIIFGLHIIVYWSSLPKWHISYLTLFFQVKEMTAITVGAGMTAEAAYVMEMSAITDPTCA